MQTALMLPTPGPVLASIAPLPSVRTKIAPTKPVTGKEPASSTDPATLMLFGLDKRGKAHGARFIGSKAAVEQAADLMDFFLVTADTDALRGLAAKLTLGKLFGSGKALVPFCSGAIYDQLLAATGTPDTSSPVKAAGKAAEAGGGAGRNPSGAAGGSGAGDPPATRIGAKAPSDHSQIGLGSLVLADDEEGGYYAAQVVLTKADDHFVLQWADYPDLPQFSRSRRALALLHPEAAAELA
ncbi:hypothetical protein FV222_04995 [Methylobacterium sp. WL103]|uniref:hypothetical protein n=1 Tax=Methylobacterium sp. WL103 TaxID=2603891 RepID=UPI0011CBF147|nr:hypothetical protein [Methylobacterium sp. WL103]TXN06631.1 hypothetical protein FV222_04995 [Methylobacterium sp. WL103]